MPAISARLEAAQRRAVRTGCSRILRSAGRSPSSSLGNGLGRRRVVPRDGWRRRMSSARKGRNLVHVDHLKQKSPPVGGRAVDDRMASRSVAPSRRKGRAAPPQAGGRASGDGVQVRHSNRVVRQGLARGQAALAVDASQRRWHLGARASGCSSMVEQKPSKLTTRVRFPSPAPDFGNAGGMLKFGAPERQRGATARAHATRHWRSSALTQCFGAPPSWRACLHLWRGGRVVKGSRL